MRIIANSVARYFPDPEKIGGIQVNIRDLAPELLRRGFRTTVLASTDEAGPSTYTHDGLDVFRYPTAPSPAVEPTAGERPHTGFEHFVRRLEHLKPDLYHQHQWTPKCGQHHLLAARALGLPTVVSIHVPLPLCVKQTMMTADGRACDGRIHRERCVACVSQSRSSSAFYGAFAEGEASGVALSDVGDYAQSRVAGLEVLAEHADIVVVACSWLEQALIANQFPRHKIRTSRYGIQVSPPSGLAPGRLRDPKAAFRIAFFGRLTPMKGAHTVVSALEALGATEPVELSIFGIAQDGDYEARLRQRAALNPNVIFRAPVPTDQIHAVMRDFDLVVVPSEWLETGPLTVMHAFASGVPVLGANLGGVAEQIRDGVDGLLVEPGSVSAWASAIARLISDPDLLQRLKSGISEPRTVADQAADLADVYVASLAPRPAEAILS